MAATVGIDPLSYLNASREDRFILDKVLKAATEHKEKELEILASLVINKLSEALK